MLENGISAFLCVGVGSVEQTEGRGWVGVQVQFMHTSSHIVGVPCHKTHLIINNLSPSQRMLRSSKSIENSARFKKTIAPAMPPSTFCSHK